MAAVRLPASYTVLDEAEAVETIMEKAVKRGENPEVVKAKGVRLQRVAKKVLAALAGTSGDAEADKPDPAPMRLALAACGVPPSPAVWYVGDTALDMQAARAAGCAAVLLGDAEHDGGVANAMPDAAFPDGHALAAHLLRLAKTPCPAGS